jgi:arylformamidase
MEKSDEWYNQEYNAYVQAPGYAKDAIYRSRSDDAAARLERISNVVFDEKSGQTLDIYPAGKGAPLFVWIHGGYWRSSSKDENIFVVPALVNAGVAVASIDYTLAPRADIAEITRQVYSSLSWLHGNAPNYDINAKALHVGGHSAGGHLTAMACSNNWQETYGVPSEIIHTATPISGIFDLLPMQRTFVNEALKLSSAQIEGYSPIHQIPPNSHISMLMAYGGNESSEFARQTNDYAAAWRGAGNAVEIVGMPGFHHFDVILELERPESPLVTEILKMISKRA